MLNRIHMGRWLALAASMALALLACVSPQIALFPPTSTPTATPGLVPDLLTPQATIPFTPVATLPRGDQLPTPTVAATATPAIPYLTGDVRLYPGPLHYSGDLVTIEVVVRNTANLGDDSLATVSIDDDPTPLSAQAYLDVSPLRDDVLVFRWAWDTQKLTGMHQLTVSLPSRGGRPPQVIMASVNLLPESERPIPETLAIWDVRNTACCNLRFVTHTPAERDIFSLSDQANKAVLAVEQKTGFAIGNKPIPLTFLDIEWGNGAYTSNEVVMSYVDRNFIPSDFDTVLRHEITHWAFRRLGNRAPIILAEGVAVFVSGGHYKPEPLAERGAAVIGLNMYVPLHDLADHFRDYQHEVAYIEAGSLVEYLSETYGWGKFLAVYGSDQIEGGGSEWLDEAFKATYGKGLDEIERGYRAWLRAHEAGSQVDDVRMTIALFDTARHYQDQYSMYQESLPSSQDAVNVGQTAEFMRESTAPENVALEAALETAGNQLKAGEYAALEDTLAGINAALDNGDFTQAPVADYLAIAKALAAAGLEGQTISIETDIATVKATRVAPRLVTVMLLRTNAGWQIQDERAGLSN